MAYSKDSIKSNKTSKKSIPKNIELTIVNGLEFELDCQIESNGNNLTIWITKKIKE